MNPGGVRAGLFVNQISGGEQPGEVTFGEMFTVQPFSNTLVVKTCTGAQIEALLEQQFVVQTPNPRILLPSDSLRYTYTASGPAGNKVDPASIKIDGVAVNPAAPLPRDDEHVPRRRRGRIQRLHAVHAAARRRGRPRRVRCGTSWTTRRSGCRRSNRITRLP